MYIQFLHEKTAVQAFCPTAVFLRPVCMAASVDPAVSRNDRQNAAIEDIPVVGFITEAQIPVGKPHLVAPLQIPYDPKPEILRLHLYTHCLFPPLYGLYHDGADTINFVYITKLNIILTICQHNFLYFVNII